MGQKGRPADAAARSLRTGPTGSEGLSPPADLGVLGHRVALRCVDREMPVRADFAENRTTTWTGQTAASAVSSIDSNSFLVVHQAIKRVERGSL